MVKCIIMIASQERGNKMKVIAIIAIFFLSNIPIKSQVKSDNLVSIGLYSKGKCDFPIADVSWLDSNHTKKFQNLLRAANSNELNFSWDKQGLYIIKITEGGKAASGYEWKPWLKSKNARLLPIRFRIDDARKMLLFDGYQVGKNWSVPSVRSTELENIFEKIYVK